MLSMRIQMIEKVHEHIINELRQNTRTDTIFILAALFLNFLTLGINSGVAAGTGIATTFTMLILIALVIVVNLVVIFGLLKGKQTRSKLINGLLKMYKDQDVEGYYDPSIITNYDKRYTLFILTVLFTGFTAISIPLVIRLSAS